MKRLRDDNGDYGIKIAITLAYCLYYVVEKGKTKKAPSMAAEQPGSRGHAGATDPAVASGRAVCVLSGIGGEARATRQPARHVFPFLAFAPKTVF